MPHDFQADLDAVAAIAAVPTILDVVCRITGMGFAAVARVTEDRWICCSARDLVQFGLAPGGELKIETTICNEIRDHRQAVVIDHVAEDPLYRDHHTPAAYGLQSYISMPIILADGSFFGTLCAIDPKPHIVNTPAIVGMFKLFAELIAFHLHAHSKLSAAEASLLSERQGAELREQFIAVLGHDLRNPLAAIDAGVRLLQRTPLNERATMVTGQMHASVVRMSGLITNVLDFARGRLGGGILLERRNKVQLQPMLELVIGELQATLHDRVIESDFTGLQPLNCDPDRLGQMLSNLLGNAISHGAPATPIQVKAMTGEREFTLTVANQGDPIPQATIALLFRPFFRAATGANQQGLGLGLYIAAEIARAHGGTLTASSDDNQIRFVFTMPLAP